MRRQKEGVSVQMWGGDEKKRIRMSSESDRGKKREWWIGSKRQMTDRQE